MGGEITFQPWNIHYNRRHIAFSRSSAPLSQRIHQTTSGSGETKSSISAVFLPAKVLFVKGADFDSQTGIPIVQHSHVPDQEIQIVQSFQVESDHKV